MTWFTQFACILTILNVIFYGIGAVTGANTVDKFDNRAMILMLWWAIINEIINRGN